MYQKLSAESNDCSDSKVTVSVSVLVPGVLTNQTVVAGAGEIRLSCQVRVVLLVTCHVSRVTYCNV